jgi:hypothetical protein
MLAGGGVVQSEHELLGSLAVICPGDDRITSIDGEDRRFTAWVHFVPCVVLRTRADAGGLHAELLDRTAVKAIESDPVG